MKKKLLVIILFFAYTFTYAQFTTGTVDLTANRSIKIDTNATTATMTLTGPSTAWLGIGFGGTSMATVTDMFIWNATANRDYIAPGGHVLPTADTAAAQSWQIVSDIISGTTRTIIATRALVSNGDYTFLNDNSNIPIIYSQGSTTTLAYHGNNPHAAIGLPRTQLGSQAFLLSETQIYPNPSNGEFLIKASTAIEIINIYSQTGSFVRSIEVNDKSNSVEINVNGLQTGVYLVELVGSNNKTWKKVIVN